MGNKPELDKLADEGRALGAEISVRMKRMQGKSVLPEVEQLLSQLAGCKRHCSIIEERVKAQSNELRRQSTIAQRHKAHLVEAVALLRNATAPMEFGDIPRKWYLERAAFLARIDASAKGWTDSTNG